ncbi:hypothetical protein AB0E59_32225 [Lentzea sp. NPDC034063]
MKDLLAVAMSDLPDVADRADRVRAWVDAGRRRNRAWRPTRAGRR